MHYIQSVLNKGHWGGERFKNKELNIYCPDQIAKDFPTYWRIHLPEWEERYYPFPKLIFKPMSSEKERFQIGNGILTARKVYHGWGKTDALAFRLETPEGVFVYSGDYGDCKGIREITKNADIFVSECTKPIGEPPNDYGHIDPYAAGDIARNSGAKKIVFFHYTGLDEDEAIIKDCRRSGYAGEAMVGKDFQVIEI